MLVISKFKMHVRHTRNNGEFYIANQNDTYFDFCFVGVWKFLKNYSEKFGIASIEFIRIYRKVPSFEGRKGKLYVLKETH